MRNSLLFFVKTKRRCIIVFPTKISLLFYVYIYIDTQFESFSIPSGVLTIGRAAFKNNANLASIVIPDSVITLGDYCFANDVQLTNVTIGKNIKELEGNTFWGCIRLVEVYNRSSISLTVGDESICCYWAKNIYTYEGGSRLSTTPEGFVIYTEGNLKSLVAYNGSERILVLPNYITDINQYAFYDNEELLSITIPSTVSSIGKDAFYNCNKLVEVINCSSLDIKAGSGSYGSVGGYASIINTSDRESKVNIDENGFVICQAGSSVILVEYTGVDAEIELPMGITRIRGKAFTDCQKLISIVIPNSIRVIEGDSFINCSQLQIITFDNLDGYWWYSYAYGIYSIEIESGKNYVSSLINNHDRWDWHSYAYEDLR